MSRRAQKVQEFPAHASNVNCLKIGRKSSGVLVTGGDDCKVNMWLIGKNQAVYSLAGHQSPVECVTFDGAEEVVLAGAASGTVKMWDMEARPRHPRLAAPSTGPCVALLSPHACPYPSHQPHPS